MQKKINKKRYYEIECYKKEKKRELRIRLKEGEEYLQSTPCLIIL